MKGWLAGVAATILGGVVVYWLTVGVDRPQPASPTPTTLGTLVQTPNYRMSEDEPGIDRYGSDYKDLQVQNLQECREVCLKEPQCRAFSFNRSANQCWLKNSVPLRKENATFISGVKIEG
jgi:hypothetical protein